MNRRLAASRIAARVAAAFRGRLQSSKPNVISRLPHPSYAHVITR
jgi:hypothetical protein